MKMNLASLSDKAGWEKAGVTLPAYDVEKMAAATKENPIWVHFGAGNIFRGFVAELQQKLLNEGKADRGIIAVDTFDYDIINLCYHPYDNLCMVVTLHADGSMDKDIMGAVAESVAVSSADASFDRMKEIFRNPSLQMVSFTITEKGYAIYDLSGNFMKVVAADIEEGPAHARHAMSVVCAMLLERFNAGKLPLAVVSMDNCSHNGEKLKASIVTIAEEWQKKGFVTEEFVEYVKDEETVSFPWSMIDKITPRPDKKVEAMLAESGVEDMGPIKTSRGTFVSPFVNAEVSQYLVIEDRFPNGRPALEEAGVYMTTRDVVNMTERMKVTTCLNPLHTAMSVFGVVLGYDHIAKEMKDADIVGLITKIGYVEGLPVVTDPGILRPADFIDEVVKVRLPNPFIPDMPQRIATDTSQKVGIRFGETIKSYAASDTLKVEDLTCIPLAIAGWFRYLLGVDDKGQKFECSDDPLLADLQAALADVVWNDPESYKGQLLGILANKAVFGSDLVELGLAEKIEGMFKEMLAGEGSVRETLHKYAG